MNEWTNENALGEVEGRERGRGGENVLPDIYIDSEH